MGQVRHSSHFTIRRVFFSVALYCHLVDTTIIQGLHGTSSNFGP